MKRLVACFVFLSFTTVHVARADVNLAQRMEGVAVDAAKDYQQARIKIETHGVDAFLEVFTSEIFMNPGAKKFLRHELLRAGSLPEVKVHGYALDFVGKNIPQTTLTPLPDGKILVNVLGKKAVWTLAGDPRIDQPALLAFVTEAMRSNVAPVKTSWLQRGLEKTVQWILPEAHAFGWNNLWPILVTAAIIITGYCIYRRTTNALKETKNKVQQELQKVGDATSKAVTNVGDAAVANLNKAGDAITQIGNSVSTNVTNVANSAVAVLDASAAAVNQAQANATYSPTNGVVTGTLTH